MQSIYKRRVFLPPPYLHHSNVCYAIAVFRHLHILPITSHLHKPHGHVGTRYAHMVEAQEPIVHAVKGCA